MLANRKWPAPPGASTRGGRIRTSRMTPCRCAARGPFAPQRRREGEASLRRARRVPLSIGLRRPTNQSRHALPTSSRCALISICCRRLDGRNPAARICRASCARTRAARSRNGRTGAVVNLARRSTFSGQLSAVNFNFQRSTFSHARALDSSAPHPRDGGIQAQGQPGDTTVFGIHHSNRNGSRKKVWRPYYGPWPFGAGERGNVA